MLCALCFSNFFMLQTFFFCCSLFFSRFSNNNLLVSSSRETRRRAFVPELQIADKCEQFIDFERFTRWQQERYMTNDWQHLEFVNRWKMFDKFKRIVSQQNLLFLSNENCIPTALN